MAEEELPIEEILPDDGRLKSYFNSVKKRMSSAQLAELERRLKSDLEVVASEGTFAATDRWESVCSIKFLLDAVPDDQSSNSRFDKYRGIVEAYEGDPDFVRFFRRRLARDREILERRARGEEGAELVTDGFSHILMVEDLKGILAKGKPDTHDETYFVVRFERQEAYRISLAELRKDSEAEVFPGVPVGSVLTYDFTDQGLELHRKDTQSESGVYLNRTELRSLDVAVSAADREDAVTKSYLTDVHLAMRDQLFGDVEDWDE